MIAVDTNILVYAHRRDSQWHVPAVAAIASLASGPERWAVPWPCVHEFYAVVTHPRIYSPASSPDAAIDQLEAWLESPTLETIGEESSYWAKLRDTLRDGRVQGARVHDARIASLCELHGVRELWSADRDFTRFPKLVTRNPLLP